MVEAIPVIVTALVVRSWRPLGDQRLVMLCQYFQSNDARRDNVVGNRNTAFPPDFEHLYHFIGWRCTPKIIPNKDFAAVARRNLTILKAGVCP